MNSISEVPARQIGMKAEAARFALAPFFGVLTLYALLGVALTALLYFTGAALGSFAIASLLVVLYALIPLAAWFGVRKARERHVPDLATLSADTAHEIRTPLLTMCVLLDELRRSTEPPTDWKESIDTLWSQMQICRRCLATMAPAPTWNGWGGWSAFARAITQARITTKNAGYVEDENGHRERRAAG